MARRPKAPINLSVLFDSKVGTLAQIKAKTNSLMLLSNIVRQICPDLPENAFNIANFVQSTLIIEVKSPVWGQRLQFERNNICQQLTIQTQGQFTQIEIKVNPQGHR
ncbi:MAG: DciA family protein, partial [Colwellia sp.]